MAFVENQQKVADTLGRRLHDLRISVTDKCNLRCTYCMPADQYHEQYSFLPKDQLLTFEEITRIARVFVDLGVTKLRLTGGEPLLRKDLPSLVSMLREIEGVEDLALTTNGLLLPLHAKRLKEAGLDRVTISLDALDDTVFGQMNGRNVSVEPVLEGIRAAEEAELLPVKINVVVQRGVNEHFPVAFAQCFRHTRTIVRFIEYMDVGNCNGWARDQVVPSVEVRDQIAVRFPLEPLGPEYQGEVAERYRYVDGQGEVGFISSVTQPFCGACSRARLSADGKVFTCLFAGHGTDIRAPLRAGADFDALRVILRNLWSTRNDRYSELRAAMSSSEHVDKKVEMYQIGG